VDDLAHDIAIKDGCVKAAGSLIPAGYFLDLIWDVTGSSFRARLLDDTTCAQNDVPFVFSSDRKQVTLVVSKGLLTNQALIPDPNAFQYFAALAEGQQNGNNSFFNLDLAPNENNGPSPSPVGVQQRHVFLSVRFRLAATEETSSRSKTMNSQLENTPTVLQVCEAPFGRELPTAGPGCVQIMTLLKRKRRFTEEKCAMMKNGNEFRPSGNVT
jgi:hypothetical protein